MANNEEVCPAIVTSTIGFIGASLIELISIEFIEEQNGGSIGCRRTKFYSCVRSAGDDEQKKLDYLRRNCIILQFSRPRVGLKFVDF